MFSKTLVCHCVFLFVSFNLIREIIVLFLYLSDMSLFIQVNVLFCWVLILFFFYLSGVPFVFLFI